MSKSREAPVKNIGIVLKQYFGTGRITPAEIVLQIVHKRK